MQKTAFRLSKMGFDKKKIHQATGLSFPEIETALAIVSSGVNK